MHGNARFCTVSAFRQGSRQAFRQGSRQAGGGGEGGNAGEMGETLRERQLAAMGLLLLGKPYLAVARAVGVDPSTLYRWRQDDAFRAELERRAEEMWDGAGVRLRALVHPALDVLEEEVHDEYDRSRVRAAGMILRFAGLRKSAAPRRAEG